MYIRLQTLGPPRCYANGALTDLSAQRTRFALLVYLAITKTAARESVCALFWPERDEERARHTLAQTLYQLRRTLGEEWIEPQADPLTVTGLITIDALQFEDLIRTGDVASALSLYTGDFLDGFHIKGSNEFEAWVQAQRRDLKRLYHRAAREYVQTLKTDGELAAAIAVAEQWVLVDPLDDEANHALVELLINAGQRTAAVTVYDQYERRIKAELDVRPLEQTQQLISELRTQGIDALETPVRVAPLKSPPAQSASQTAPSLSFWRELKERRVLRMTGWYLATAFLALQATQLVIDMFTLPPWVLTLAGVLAAAGLPLTLVLSWFYEIGPDGRLVRDQRAATARHWRVAALGAAGTVAVIAVMLVAPIVGSAVDEPDVTLFCEDGSPLPCARKVAIEENRFAVFPLSHQHGAGSGLTGEMCALMLTDGLRHWDDIKLVQNQAIRDALRHLPASVRAELPIDSALAIGRRVGAGRIITGELREQRDSTRVDASLYDGVNGTVLKTKSARFATGSVEAEAVFRKVAQELVVNDVAVNGKSLDFETGIATSSYAAMLTLQSALLFMEDWDLPAARDRLEAALSYDASYPYAHLWLSYVMLWGNDTTDEWRLHTARAAGLSGQMTPLHQKLAHAVAALANRRYAQACERYREILAQDSLSFHGWFGLGECLRLDRSVVRDSTSPSGWSFAASWHEAIRAHEHALWLDPSSNKAFTNLGASRLESLLFLTTARTRTGLSDADSSFAASPELVADTLSLIPYPFNEWSVRVRPPGTPLLVQAHRKVLSKSALTWVAAFPENPRAIESLAWALELEGRLTSRDRDNSAYAAIRRARMLSTDRSADVRMASTEARILLKAGRYKAAHRVVEQALRDHDDAHGKDALLLSGLAGMIGQAHRMASLLVTGADSIDHDRPLSGQLVDIPQPLARTTAALLAYAYVGEPADSLRTLAERAHGVLNTLVPIERRAAVHQTGLDRAARMLFPVLGVEDAHARGEPGSGFLQMQAKFARADTTATLRDLDSLKARLLQQNPADVASDGILSYAQLRLAANDTVDARAMIDRYLADIGNMPRGHFRQPYQPVSVVRLMVLRAEIADKSDERAVARRWARAVVDLWQTADDELSPTMRRMRRLARSWYRV